MKQPQVFLNIISDVALVNGISKISGSSPIILCSLSSKMHQSLNLVNRIILNLLVSDINHRVNERTSTYFFRCTVISRDGTNASTLLDKLTGKNKFCFVADSNNEFITKLII